MKISLHMNLVIAIILAISAIMVRLNPKLINVLSEEDRKRMNAKKTGRYAFWGLMTTALVMALLYACGIRHELVPIFVCIPGAIVTAALIQWSIPTK